MDDVNQVNKPSWLKKCSDIGLDIQPLKKVYLVTEYFPDLDFNNLWSLGLFESRENAVMAMNAWAQQENALHKKWHDEHAAKYPHQQHAPFVEMEAYEDELGSGWKAEKWMCAVGEVEIYP